MKITNQELWNKGRENNQDDYGKAIYDYAESWANLMEERLSRGEKLEGFAEETSHLADTDGITGFMYVAAVSILASLWEHGEELRKWHNLSLSPTQGAEANKRPNAVLDPTSITIKGGD